MEKTKAPAAHPSSTPNLMLLRIGMGLLIAGYFFKDPIMENVTFVQARYAVAVFFGVLLTSRFLFRKCPSCGKSDGGFHATCTSCKKSTLDPIRKSFRQKLDLSLQLGFLALIAFGGEILAFGFSNAPFFKNGAAREVASLNHVYDEVRDQGEGRTLDNMKLVEEYDPSTWNRIGRIQAKNDAGEVSIIYNLDSPITPEDFLKAGGQVKCVQKPKAVVCIPEEYFNNEAAFRQSNSVERMRGYMREQFNGVMNSTRTLKEIEEGSIKKS